MLSALYLRLNSIRKALFDSLHESNDFFIPWIPWVEILGNHGYMFFVFLDVKGRFWSKILQLLHEFLVTFYD